MFELTDPSLDIVQSVQICSRDEAALRRRSLSLTYKHRKRGLFSSLKGLDNLTKRGRDKRPSASQVNLVMLNSPFSMYTYSGKDVAKCSQLLNLPLLKYSMSSYLIC